MTSAPSQFTFHARNPEHNRRSAAIMVFGNVSSPPNCSDMEGGRRTGNLADYRNFLKLSQYFNSIHFLGGYPVEPIDVHASIRHLEALRDAVMLTDKPFHAYSLGKERILDGIEIARIARGISHGADRARAFAVHDHQHQFAAEARYAHAARHYRDVVAQPDRLHDALHACRRHGAGDGRRRRG